MILLNLLLLILLSPFSYAADIKVTKKSDRSKVALEEIKKTILESKPAPKVEKINRGSLKWTTHIVDLTRDNNFFSVTPFMVEWDLFTKDIDFLTNGLTAGLKGHVRNQTSGIGEERRSDLGISGTLKSNTFSTELSLRDRSHNILLLENSRRMILKNSGRFEGLYYRADIFNQYTQFKKSKVSNVFSLFLHLGYDIDLKNYFDLDHIINLSIESKSDYVTASRSGSLKKTRSNGNIRINGVYTIPKLSIFRDIVTKISGEVSFGTEILGGYLSSRASNIFEQANIKLTYGIFLENLYRSVSDYLQYLDFPHIYVNEPLKKDKNIGGFVSMSWSSSNISTSLRVSPYYSYAISPKIGSLDFMDGDVMLMHMNDGSFILDLDIMASANYNIFFTSIHYSYKLGDVLFMPDHELKFTAGIDDRDWNLFLTMKYLHSFKMPEEAKGIFICNLDSIFKISERMKINTGIRNLFNTTGIIAKDFNIDSRRFSISISFDI